MLGLCQLKCLLYHKSGTRQHLSVGRVASVISKEEILPLDSRSPSGTAVDAPVRKLGKEAATLITGPFPEAPGHLSAKCFTLQPSDPQARTTPLGDDERTQRGPEYDK